MAADQGKRGVPASGLNLLVMTPERIDEVMAQARSILEVQHRHELELVREGFNWEEVDLAQAKNGNCNTSNCLC